MKKFLILPIVSLVALTSVASFAACGPGGYDSSVTHLTVMNYDGGVGKQWLENVSEKFEKEYAQTSFEDGKTGVKIDIFDEKLNGSNGVKTSTYAVWFAEDVTYNDLIGTNELLDISDIVKQPLTEISGGKESGTIEAKLSDEQKKALTAVDGKYYVLPHYEVYTGLTYDRDLFDERGYYFAANGGFTDADAEKTVGPDGVRNTYDDGLPSSYEELYALMDYMVADGVIPFTWTAATENYVNDLFAGLWASYAGKDEFMLNVNFDSSLTDTQARIINFSGNEAVESAVEINQENGYLLSRQSAKYYAYELFEKIMSKNEYHTKLDKATSHLDTQEKYILSNLKANESPVAMLIDGSYWYNEAGEALKRSVNTYKEQAENRQFAWMPLPVQYKGSVKEGEGKKNTLLETVNSFAFINARYKNDPIIEPLAKLFLQYCYTDEALVDFSLTTGTAKGVRYNLSSTDIDGLDNYYQKSLLNLKQNSDIIYAYSDHPIFINHQNQFTFLQHSEIWSSTVSGKKYANFYAGYKSNVRAKEYFEGSVISQTKWNELYSADFKR